AAFSEWARIGLTPRSLKCNRVRRNVDSTKKTWLIPVPAKARANHAAPFITAVSLILFPPHSRGTFGSLRAYAYAIRRRHALARAASVKSSYHLAFATTNASTVRSRRPL